MIFLARGNNEKIFSYQSKDIVAYLFRREICLNNDQI